MDAITRWLKEFRDDIVNKLAKDDLDLPLDPYSFGNLLLGSLVGGVLLLPLEYSL